MTHLKAGDKAPDFNGLTETGDQVSLADFKGKKLILFFYPKDNTPTCTEEVCNLRDNYAALKAKGYELLGVSADSARKHQHFIKKYKLPFPLIADTERVIIDKYGVWGPKQLFGIHFDGIYRTTFVINEKGKIEKVITQVDSDMHAEQILQKEKSKA